MMEKTQIYSHVDFSISKTSFASVATYLVLTSPCSIKLFEIWLQDRVAMGMQI